MERRYTCNCSKCRKKREALKNKKTCNNICVKQTRQKPKKRRRKCYTNSFKCNCNNNCGCNCKNKCRINPLFWIFALLLI